MHKTERVTERSERGRTDLSVPPRERNAVMRVAARKQRAENLCDKARCVKHGAPVAESLTHGAG